MIEHLAILIDSFPGAANQTRCFTHILNLVAKSILRQFEAPKAKGGKVLDDAARELAAIFDELDKGLNGGHEEGGEGNDDEDDNTIDNDEDGLPEERDGMSGRVGKPWGECETDPTGVDKGKSIQTPI